MIPENIEELNFFKNENLKEIEKEVVSFDNFFLSTIATFNNCTIPEGKPDFISPSGSEYYYSENEVIRVSDHWGSSIASCSWYLKNDTDGTVAGRCNLENFEQKELRKIIIEECKEDNAFFEKILSDQIGWLEIKENGNIRRC